MRHAKLSQEEKNALRRIASSPDGKLLLSALEKEQSALREKNDKVSDMLALGRNQGAILCLSELMNGMKG